MRDARPIALLREAARAAKNGKPMPAKVAQWLAAGVEQYEIDAPGGATLDDTLGLSHTSGAGPWWVREARAVRDRALLELRDRHFADCGPTAAAAAISTLARRRQRSITPPTDAREALIDVALRAQVVFPKPRRLRAILGGQSGRGGEMP